MQLCSMDPDSFTVHIKTNNICIDITKYVEPRFMNKQVHLDLPIL